MNRICLIGNLATDPELRYTANEIPVTNFTIAVNRPFANQQGEREADFIRIVTWRKLAELCAKYLTKGRKVAIEGRLQLRRYKDSEGIDRIAAEVIASEVEFLGGPSNGNNGSGKGTNATATTTATTKNKGGGEDDFPNFDDIDFF